MDVDCVSAVNIDQDCCSRCGVCSAVCPFDAIECDPKSGKFDVNLQKCQVCGLCYSACPAKAIRTAYYDYEGLLKFITDYSRKRQANALVLMCRGNSPSSGEINELLAEEGLTIGNYIPLRLPCAGRVPIEFLFQALSNGMRIVISIQCEDDFCRYKRGTGVGARRLVLGRKVLEQLGFEKDAFRVLRYSRKVSYDTSKCVGCDKCVFICPYGAIETQDLATPKILPEHCMGCGACALVCPHQAIEIKGFEFEDTLRRYGESVKRMKMYDKSPVILVFSCQWSEFSILDSPERFRKHRAVGLEIPCFKALDPVHVVNALKNGFDGVMAVVCPEEDCRLDEGKETAERNMAVLKNVLKKMGLQKRFELIRMSPRSVGAFEERLGDFARKIRSLRPLRLETVEAEAHV